jgi:transposase
VCKVKLGYEYTYLYCAIAPAIGSLIALLLPDMSKVCFEIFIEYFKTQTKQLHGHHPVVIIMDKAGAHQKYLCEQGGLTMEHLPRGCPELNPVERFFEELRKELANHIFSTLKHVETFLSKILKMYWRNPKQIIQLCYYPYMRTS